MRFPPRLAALALCLGALGCAASARAATYVQYVCSLPDGRPIPAAGFTGAATGAAVVDDTCRSRGGLVLQVAGGAATGSAAWRYAPPPGTSVAAAVIRRSVSIPGGSRARYALGGSADRCDATTDCGDDVFDLPVPSDGLELALACPGDGCGQSATVVVRQLRITLRDDAPPAFAGGPSGGLLRPGPMRGVQSVAFTAVDRGGGVAAAALLVDDVPRAHAALGTCRPPYARPVPCPSRAAGRLRLDTRRLADGPHRVTVAVTDATGVNRTVSGAVSITVANHAPRAPAPRPPARPAAALVLRASRGRLHNGQALSLVARLAPATTTRPARVAFQVRIAGRWRTFAVRRLDGHGRARVRHRFRLTFRRLRYVFRVAAVPLGSRRAAAPSPPVAVVVLQ